MDVSPLNFYYKFVFPIVAWEYCSYLRRKTADERGFVSQFIQDYIKLKSIPERLCARKWLVETSLFAFLCPK